MFGLAYIGSLPNKYGWYYALSGAARTLCGAVEGLFIGHGS